MIARLLGSRALFRVVMIALAVVYGFPMIWMVLSSFKTNRETFRDPLALPSSIDFGVWAEAWRVGNLGRYALNSVIVTTCAVVLILLFAASPPTPSAASGSPAARCSSGCCCSAC